MSLTVTFLPGISILSVFPSTNTTGYGKESRISNKFDKKMYGAGDAQGKEIMQIAFVWSVIFLMTSGLSLH